MQRITERLSSWHLKQAYHGELKNVLGNIEVVKRLDRAYEILTRDERYTIEYTGQQYPTGAMQFAVTSPNDTYLVTEGLRECNCPDGEKLCKHRLAIRLILSAIRSQQAAGLEFQSRHGDE